MTLVRCQSRAINRTLLTDCFLYLNIILIERKRSLSVVFRPLSVVKKFEFT